MPSNKDPKTAVAAGTGKLSPGVATASALSFQAGQGSATGGASAPVPLGSEISYGGGSAWVDGTTNLANSVEGQLDKIITDLIATAGAARVGAASTGNLADGSPATGTSIQALINDLASRLASTSGGGRVGAASTGNLADGSPATGATVQALVNDVVSKLAATAGATRVGAANTGNFADGNPATGATVQALINSIVSLLTANAGSAKVGSAAVAGSPYALNAGSIYAQISQLLGFLNTASSGIRSLTGTAATLHGSGRDATLVITPSAAFTLTLPNPNTCSGWQTLLIDKTGVFGTNAVTLTRAGSEKINNLTSNYALNIDYGRWWLVSDGTDWHISYMTA